MTKKHKTNVEFVHDLMEFSDYGALSQMFVLDALAKWSKLISETDPAKVENGFVCGAAWVGVAKEINAKINNHL